jgi:hypothetical protein
LEAIINDLGTEITVALLCLFGVLFAAVFGLIGVLVGQWLNERRHRRMNPSAKTLAGTITETNRPTDTKIM